jgi:hypothetical protein
LGLGTRRQQQRADGGEKEEKSGVHRV